MVETATLRLRASRIDDIPAVADLLLQLYHAELPGALRGPRLGQQALMREILRRGRAALFRQYVAVQSDGAIVATASLRLGRDRVVGDLPEGILRMAFRELGAANALRLFGLLLRRSLTPDEAPGPEGAFVHSVVVEEGLRGRGLGAWLVDHVEQIAWRDGARAAQLRVVVGNHAAKRLYSRLGYRVVGRTPPAFDWITIPTELMHKVITPTT